MTKEEQLKQEAEEYVCKRNPLVTKEWFIDAFKKYDKGEKVKYLKDCEIAEYEAYIAGAEPREKQIQIDAEQIRALQKQNGELTDENERLKGDLELWESGACRATNLDKCSVVKELKAQIEKMKLQYDYAFNQLCKSREILCSMLSQYRDRKEIDYSTRECGEKLLKEGVYKND